MIDSGSSKFVKTATGTWINVRNISCFYIHDRNLDYDEDEPCKYAIVAKSFVVTAGVAIDELYIKPEQENWSREEWQEYLDSFMYDMGLCNGQQD